jgi:hypothetical protein
MRGKPTVLAVVFDFDETRVADSTSKPLQSRGVDPHELWTNHVRRRLEQGVDPALAYLGLILDCVLAATLRVLDEHRLMWIREMRCW